MRLRCIVAAYRGAGLALAVVAAWADAVKAAGMTPLYSTSWENAASLRVAAKLGLDACAETLSFRQELRRPRLSRASAASPAGSA